MKSKESYNLIFCLDITDGYSFRQMIDFYKTNTSAIPFIINKNFLSIKSGNGLNTMLIDTIIYRDNILKYYVNEKYFNDKENNSHNIMPELAEFYIYINSIQKQGSIKIFQYYEEQEYIYGQIYGGFKNNNGIFKIKLDKFTLLNYNFIDNIQENDFPNAKVSLTSFCNACETCIKIKKNDILLKCFQNSVNFSIKKESYDAVENIIWYSDNCIESELEETECFNIKINNMIKNLSKLKNFNSKGIIKIYCKCDKVLRLDFNTGIIGITSIYIFNK